MKKRLWTVCLAVVAAFCLCFGLAACGQKDPTALAAPTGVKVEGTTLSWTAVDDATAGYTVKIGTDETTKVTSGTTLDLNTVTDKLTAGENSIAVKANATDKNLESAYSETVKYTYTPAPTKTPLSAPTGVKVEGATLSWNAVTGATAGYTVKIGTDETTKVETGTSLDLATVTAKLKLGANTLAVKANETTENLESSYSDPATYTHTEAFDTPTGLQITEKTLTWTAVTGATEYTVKIGTDETTKVTKAELDLTTVTAKLQSGNNTISVKANADAATYHTESAYSATVNYTYTPPVEEEANDYKALVDAIDVTGFSAESNKAAAQTILAAIDAAETKYQGLSSEAEAHSIVTTAKQAFDTKKSTFEAVYNPAKTLADTYGQKVSAAKTENAKANKTGADDQNGKTLASLKAVVDAAKDAKDALNTNLARSLGAEHDADYTAVEAAYNTWKGEVDAEVKAYTDLVNAIPDAITENSTQDAAKTAHEKLEAAAAKYGQLSYEATIDSRVTAALATYTTKNDAYTTETGKAQTAYEGFKTKLTAAQTAATEAKSVSDLESKINEAKGAKTGLSTLAGGLVTTADTEALSTLDSTLGTWKQTVTKEAGELTITTELDPENDETAEQIIKAVDALLEADKELPVYVTTAEEYTTAKTALESKKTNAETQLNKTVETLETDIGNTLQESDINEATEANYKKLKALQDRVDALGDYAKNKFGQGEKGKDLAGAIETMLAKVVKTETTETILYNSDKPEEMPSIVIVRKPMNVAGEGVKLDTDPTVTATEKFTIAEGRTDEEAKSITPVVQWDADAKAYIITITFTERLAYNKSAEENTDTVEVTYQIGQEEKVSYTLRATKYISYFDTAEADAAYKATGELNISGGGGGETTYIDIYRAGDVVKNADRNVSVQFKGVRIAQETSKTIGSVTELRRALAAAGITGDITVQLYVYQRWEENGQIFFTAANSASVSAELELKGIQPEEAKHMLDSKYLSTALRQSGEFEIYTPGYISDINKSINKYSGETQLSEDASADNPAEKDMQKYLQARIRAITVGEEGAITVLHEEVVEMKFIAYNLNTFISAWTLEYFKAHFEEYNGTEKEDPTFNKVKYQVCYEPKETVEGAPNPLCKMFRASEWITAKQETTNTEEFDVTLQKADVTATSEQLANFTTGRDYFEFLRKPGHNGEVFIDYKAAHVEFKLEKDDESYTLYFFYVDNTDDVPNKGIIDNNDKLYLYTSVDKDNLEDKDKWLDCATVANGYTTVSAFNDWMKKTYTLEAFDATEWTVYTRVVVDTNSLWLFDGDWSEAITCPTAG